MKLTLFWIISCLMVISISAASPVDDLKETQELLQLTLKAIRGILNFFDKDYKNVNLDAVIGTRMVAGEFLFFLFL